MAYVTVLVWMSKNFSLPIQSLDPKLNARNEYLDRLLTASALKLSGLNSMGLGYRSGFMCTSPILTMILALAGIVKDPWKVGEKKKYIYIMEHYFAAQFYWNFNMYYDSVPISISSSTSLKIFLKIVNRLWDSLTTWSKYTHFERSLMLTGLSLSPSIVFISSTSLDWNLNSRLLVHIFLLKSYMLFLI